MLELKNGIFRAGRDESRAKADELLGSAFLHAGSGDSDHEPDCLSQAGSWSLLEGAGLASATVLAS